MKKKENMDNIYIEPITSNLEKIPRYHDRVGVRFDRLPVEPLILLKLISTLGRNLGTISLYRVDRI